MLLVFFTSVSLEKFASIFWTRTKIIERNEFGFIAGKKYKLGKNIKKKNKATKKTVKSKFYYYDNQK